ncbi:hypothetical protein TNCV_3187751 [Trichonephila clavipes]|nr:hypothetical protein TNCV_3187751 [Trichonephila clavipes]
MVRFVDKIRPLPGHSSIGSISVKHNFVLACPHHGVQQGRQCVGHLAKIRHGAYLEYTQNIVLQQHVEDPTGKPATPYLQHQPYSSVSSGTPKRGTTSRLTGAGSLLPPVYSKEWAKENAEVCLSHQSFPYGRSVSKKNSKDPQNTIFLLTGRRTRQSCGLANQRC